jgi:general secretion pathway protein G
MKTLRSHPRVAGNARGFTLVEIVIVIALIGLILAVVANRIMGSQARAEYKLAQTQLQTLSGKIEQYQADVGSLPDSLDQLITAPANASGWLGPYSRKEELQDPWHHPIDYRRPGDDGRAYQLTSLGADGKAGGEGVDKDLVAP